MENINWYPGHMKKTRELIEANLRLVGAVLEVCDARIPLSSRNPVIEELCAGKPRITILNKSDLADEETTKLWLRALSKRGKDSASNRYSVPGVASVLALNSKAGLGINKLLAKLQDIEKESTGHGRLRIMIVGVPNSGKSSLINRLAGRKAAQTGDRPGVTKGKQWLKLENGIQLLDTPGILWPKFEDPNVGRSLAFCGSIKDEIMDLPDLALELLKTLLSGYPGLLEARYGIDISRLISQDYPIPISNEQAVNVMDEMAGKRGCLLPGKRIDYERISRILLDEFRAGIIGRISLERPNE